MTYLSSFETSSPTSTGTSSATQNILVRTADEQQTQVKVTQLNHEKPLCTAYSSRTVVIRLRGI